MFLASSKASDAKPPDESIDTFRKRNDDSFSSLPSTHASRDPFLNEYFPIDITQGEHTEDRQRPLPSHQEGEDLRNANATLDSVAR